MTFFNVDNMISLRFNSNYELYEHLQIEAYREGFKIRCRQSKNSKYGEFYCSFGGRCKKHTNKTSCLWKFKTTTLNHNGHEYIVIRNDKSLHLQHNHIITPIYTADKTITNDTREIINDMNKAGIKPYQIKNYLEQQNIVNLTTSQISTLTHKKDIEEFSVQSEKLIEYVKQNGGIHFEKNINLGNTIKRVAVLTFMNNECENLIKYGDVLFIDGTQVDNELKWEVIPITGITKDVSICCCGILFTALNTKDILLWFLELLWSNNQARQIYHTFITDEDQAFIEAFDNFVTNINKNSEDHICIKHVLCAMHKKKNFMKCLNKCLLNQVQKNTASNLFDVLAYSFNHNYASDALLKLKTYSPKLKLYIEEEIEPYVYHFSKSFIGNHFTAGYNTTSPAESMNRMLKRSLVNGSHTLLDLRIHFSNVLCNHYNNIFIRGLNYRRQQGRHMIFKMLSKKITENIEKQMEISDYVIICNNDDIETKQMYPYIAKVKNTNNLYYLNNEHCTCNMVTLAGYPCSHILKLYNATYTNFPCQFIHPRWLITQEEDYSQYEKNIENINFDKTIDDENNYIQESDIDELSIMTEKQRYLKIYYECKQLASIASRSPHNTKDVLETIKKKRNLLLNIQEEKNLENFEKYEEEENNVNINSIGINVEDITDHIGRKPGRPKKIRNGSGCTYRKKNSMCIICDNKHETSDCLFFNELLELQNKFTNDDGTRHCSLCGSPHHNIRTCTLRQKAIKYYLQ